MAHGGNRTGVLVVGSVALIAGAGIGGWLLWWKPKQERAHAQGQVTAWEQRWNAVRTCLLGAQPLAADPADALAIAELASGQVQRASSACLEQVKTLTRPEGEAAAIEAVEDAWQEVEAAIPAVAQAFALRFSARDEEIDERVADLGVAITALDAAQDRLRGAAGLPALTRSGTHTPLRLPAPVAVTGGGAGPISGLTAGSAAAGALTWSSDADGEADELAVLRVVTGPAAGFEVRWAGEATLAHPDRSWMTWVAEPEVPPDGSRPATRSLRVAPTGPAAPATATQVAALDGEQQLEIVAALGTGAERAVLAVRYEAAADAEDAEDAALPGGDPFADEDAEDEVLPGKLVWWTSADGGATWQERTPLPAGYPDAQFAVPALTGYAGFTDWRAGTIDVVLGTATGDLLIQLSGGQPAVLPPPVAIPDGDLGDACRRGGTSWWLAAGLVYRARGGEITQRPLAVLAGELRVADCTTDAVMIEEASSPVVYHRCTAQGCAQAFRGGGYAFGRAALLDDGGVVYVAGRGHILALWRDGTTDPTYLALPRPLTLHAVVVWGGVAHALVYDPDDPDRALLAVPLPAR